MTTYILRRILQAIPIMILLSIFLFGIVHLMPGGPLAQGERNPNVTPEQLAAMRERLGLDDPLPLQYVKWVKAFVLEGDWGYSIKFRRPVADMIAERVPPTLLLFGAGFVIMLIFAMPPLVAFHAGFDQAMLDRDLRETLGVRLPNPWLDLALLAPALVSEARLPQAALDDWLGYFGLRAGARHRAADDAFVTAELFLVLLARARARGLTAVSMLHAACEQQARLVPGGGAGGAGGA